MSCCPRTVTPRVVSADAPADWLSAAPNAIVAATRPERSFGRQDGAFGTSRKSPTNWLAHRACAISRKQTFRLTQPRHLVTSQKHRGSLGDKTKLSSLPAEWPVTSFGR